MNRQADEALRHYEGLIRKTAGRIAHSVEMEYEDICQFLRLRAWQALTAFDSSKVKSTSGYSLEKQRDRFVFSCLVNASKDVLKRKRHNLLSIEDVAARPLMEPSGDAVVETSRDRFDQRYLCEDDTFTDGLDQVLVPSTLTKTERAVLLLMYLDFKPTEIVVQAHLSRKEVATAMTSIRAKMADWDPGYPDSVAIAPVQVVA